MLIEAHYGQQEGRETDWQRTNPLERLESRSVTILGSMTEPSPRCSSKKNPRSLAVMRAASWETKTDRASESSFGGRDEGPFS